jgi:hypothetical protein
MINIRTQGVDNVMGLATEPTENPEIFLKELSRKNTGTMCDLCGKKSLAHSFSHS